jgi:hypothetical protein
LLGRLPYQNAHASALLVLREGRIELVMRVVM